MDFDVPLPTNSQFGAFCEPRIREIKALEQHLSKCEHGQRAFQKLPRNMQRRNVSYNPQRLPRYLREKHKREIGYNIKINKRPSRKFRRRPANLLADYNRRQKNQVWLETHIWHAKRFHMVRKWGYVLPKTPTFKSYRASIRAATESCLVQDVSYECCLEIEGVLTEILKPIANILHPNDAVKLRKDEFTTGREAIDSMIYKKDRYPYGVIGRTNLICSSLPWQNSQHKLWIWVHPSIFENVLSILIELYDFKLIEDKNLSEKDDVAPDLVSDTTSSNTNVLKTPKYYSKLAKLSVLKDNLIKFRFTGPESCLLLKKVLIPSNIKPSLNSTSESNCPDDSQNYQKKLDNNSQHMTDDPQKLLDKSQETKIMTDNSRETLDRQEKVSWWVSFFSNPDFIKNNEEQLAIWNLFNENDLKSRKVISLVIRDVRAVLPCKKKSLSSRVTSQGDGNLQILENFLQPLHPIFDSDIRSNVTSNMKPNHEINKERGKRLIPGGSLPLTNDESRIPVLLIQRPGSHIFSLGSGWDIIIPSGWGSQMLVALSMNGAMIGGQDEEDSLIKEFLTPPSSHLMPDTEAGTLFSQEDQKNREDEYFRKPPNCRQNYKVFGIKFPFGIDWLELIRCWDSTCDNFFIVRNKDYLNYLSVKSCKKIDKINQKSTAKSGKRKTCEDEHCEDFVVKKIIKENECVSIKRKENYSFEALIKDLKNSLLYVRLVLLGKGSLEPFATICLPTEEDILHIDDVNGLNITEPSHEDESAPKRMALKMEHKRHLNRIRRKRKKARSEVLCKEENPLEKHSTMQEAVNAAVDVVNKENSDIIENIKEYGKKFNDLWLYDRSKTFQSNSRKIIGFLTHGGFCLSLGRSGGLGYVVTEPLLEFMSKETTNPSLRGQIRVLLRNPTSLQYKWARLVIVNIC